MCNRDGLESVSLVWIVRLRIPSNDWIDVGTKIAVANAKVAEIINMQLRTNIVDSHSMT